MEPVKQREKAKPVVLALDDDVIILNVVISTLKEQYRTRPFTDGEKALAYLASNHVDLILLDCMMPGLSGFDVLRRLQADPVLRAIPVIFLTGSVDGEKEVEALEMGAVDYINKPVKPRALFTRVRLQLELQAHRKHLEALVAEKTRHVKEAYRKLKMREEVTLNLLARVTDMRDHDTGNHIARTTELVDIIAADLLAFPKAGYILTAEQADDIVKSAKLHDLGKIAMPDHILLKPGKLTEEEFDVIKEHTAFGERLLTDFIQEMDDSFLATARDIACYHHEKWDGSGYPSQLKGSDIPLSARIVAIADVYDALTSARPYKDPMSHAESMAIIVENSGSHFDPYLVGIFIRHAEKIARGGEARLEAATV